MTRDEVLDAVELAAREHDAHAVGLRLVDKVLAAKWHECESEKLRAAAEIIRASGWRPIAEAPEGPLTCGKHLPSGKWISYRFFSAAHAAKEGHTHYLPEPEPPVLEVPK